MLIIYQFFIDKLKATTDACHLEITSEMLVHPILRIKFSLIADGTEASYFYLGIGGNVVP